LRPEGFRGQLTDDPSLWKINKWDLRDIRTTLATEEENEHKFINSLEIEEPEAEESLKEEINRRLCWEYPFAAVSRTPAKITVTEAKRLFDGNLSGESDSISAYTGMLIKRPKFMEEKKGLTAAEAGTVLHFVMQHLNYAGEDIPSQIDKMIIKDLLTKQQAASINIAKIQTFLQSPLGKRLKESGAVNREIPFNLELPCNELYAQVDSGVCQGENILLQGVIDCFFEEPDGLVLIDYKTDYVPEGGAEQLRDRYKSQIAYYARALETLTGKRVKAKYIYLFYNGQTLEY
jgi:ATP-dependent helicase/nuclease subunit A